MSRFHHHDRERASPLASGERALLNYGRDVRQPAPSAVARAVQVAGPLAVVESVRRLNGGTHADTHLIRLSNPELDVVLREFPIGDVAAEHEARVLQALNGLDGLVPRLLDSDVEATQTARPWVLISRLPGHANITPSVPAVWARELGQTLARLHATPPNRYATLPSVLERDGTGRAALHGPAAATVGEQWDRISTAPSVLTHYDFWSGNVLCDDGAVSGVVDWTGGGTGPAGLDVGWCRLDLYLLFDEQVADVFLASYEAATGTVTDSRLWDLWAVARSFTIVESWDGNYVPLGRDDLTASELRRRHSQWTTLLRRPGRA
jgi:aminoglycoside phosphotransferase (APT) family kinase protein